MKFFPNRLFAVLLFFLVPTQALPETLTFCYDPYPPYTLGDQGAPEGGFKVKLLAEITDQIDGLTAEITLLPRGRCQDEVRAGRIDGILPLFPNEDRESYMVFSNDTFIEESVFWYDRQRFLDGIEWSGNYDEISILRLGMLQGDFIDVGMQAAFSANSPIVRIQDVDGLFLMLEFGRVDLVAIDFAVGRYHARRIGEDERFARIERPISAKASRFGLSRTTGAANYLEAFNSAITSLQNSGRLAEILNGDP